MTLRGEKPKDRERHGWAVAVGLTGSLLLTGCATNTALQTTTTTMAPPLPTTPTTPPTTEKPTVTDRISHPPYLLPVWYRNGDQKLRIAPIGLLNGVEIDIVNYKNEGVVAQRVELINGQPDTQHALSTTYIGYNTNDAIIPVPVNGNYFEISASKPLSNGAVNVWITSCRAEPTTTSTSPAVT